MKRVFDIFCSLALLVVFALPMLLIALLVKASARGPVLYWSKRVGKKNVLFWMPKFRTMRLNAPQVATHLLADPERYLTALGRILRKTSLDELPQLYNVLKGDMSLVGPRPALYNQEDLIALRTTRGVHALRPGITGWAQIHGRDDLPIATKVEFDIYYEKHQSFLLDCKILVATILAVFTAKGVAH